MRACVRACVCEIMTNLHVPAFSVLKQITTATEFRGSTSVELLPIDHC